MFFCLQVNMNDKSYIQFFYLDVIYLTKIVNVIKKNFQLLLFDAPKFSIYGEWIYWRVFMLKLQK